ncbi:MAG: S8 family serine peptidase [Vulcanimicrobiota bacterium]
MSISPIRPKAVPIFNPGLKAAVHRAAETSKEPQDEVVLQGSPAEPPAKPDPGVVRQAIPGSYVVCIPKKEIGSFSEVFGDKVDRVLGKAGEATFLLLHQQGLDPEDIEGSYPGMQVMPNYHYGGEPYDKPLKGSTEQLPPLPQKPRHLDIINIEPAWEKTRGQSSVLSAVTDTGIDANHKQLKPSIWVNPDEIAGNHKDDDNNGRIDDIIGWDMSDNDNDPHHIGSSHHTHVHGILHAAGNMNGATGVAPGANSMALRISGGKRGYNTAVVVESYLYALNQGAKSINTSFNIDGFVGDQAIASTYRALADNDVLLFNSAGNSGALNPARSAFEDVVLVASTDTAPGRVDKRSSFSNYGHGIDIAAPGRDILSTIPLDRVGSLSGTSMASPVALGVDALVRSAHPEWNREQRWAQIAGTADNIDALNPNEAGLLGAGRVNAGRALTETLPPPTLSVREEKSRSGKLSKMVVKFDNVLDTRSANQPEAWRILDSEGNTVKLGAPKEVRLLTNEIGFDVSGLSSGDYRLVASASHLQDPFGQALDGDRDGVAGGDFVREFRVG